MMNLSKLSALALLILSLGVAQAKPAKEAVPVDDLDLATPLQSNTRLVLFNFDNDLVYNIITRDSLFTHLELRPGEKVMGFYLSDTTRWRHHVAGNRERIFVKPMSPGLFNAATLVTNMRVYEMTFRSVKNDAPWYQRVRWSIPDEGAVTSGEASGVFEVSGDHAMGAQTNGSMIGPRKPQMVQDDPDLMAALGELGGDRKSSSGAPLVSPDKLNFSYKVDGSAPFKPRQVFDDGKFIWIQLPDYQSIPAVFTLTANDQAEIVNYTVHGNYLLISQLADGVLLKLGDDEIRIRRTERCKGFFCGSNSR